MGEAARPRRRGWEQETADALHRAESSREAWGAGGLDRAAAGVGQGRPDGTGTVTNLSRGWLWREAAR